MNAQLFVRVTFCRRLDTRRNCFRGASGAAGSGERGATTVGGKGEQRREDFQF